MKPGESFQLAESWWKAGKPLTLTDTGLGKALRDFTAADLNFQSKKNFQSFNGVMNALNAVDKARLTAIQKCGSSSLYKDVKTALEKDAVISQRKTFLMNLMRKKMDPVITKEEEAIQTETKMLLSYQQQFQSIQQKIENARKQNDSKALPGLGKELGRMWTNASTLHDNGCFQSVKTVAAEYSALLSFFPTDHARVKSLVQKVSQNEKIYKELSACFEDNKSIATDD